MVLTALRACSLSEAVLRVRSLITTPPSASFCTTMRCACMVLLALRAYHLSDAKNVAAIMFNHQSCIVDCGSFSQAYLALDKGNLLLHAHQRLNRHRAVHQPDAGVGSVAVDASVGEGDSGRRLQKEQLTKRGVEEDCNNLSYK